jgi:hypothetical protein
MQKNGHFDKSRLADQIAILALYLPIIRQNLFSFVRLWNSHKIRPQRHRPGSVSGKPYLLYHHPSEGVLDHGLLFNEEKLHSIKERVQDWDLDAILPAETYSWCQDFFSSINFSFDRISLETEIDHTSPHFQVYLQLQSALNTHIQSQQLPILSLMESPTGAYRWQGTDQGEIAQVDLETDTVIPT